MRALALAGLCAIMVTLVVARVVTQVELSSRPADMPGTFIAIYRDLFGSVALVAWDGGACDRVVSEASVTEGRIRIKMVFIRHDGPCIQTFERYLERVGVGFIGDGQYEVVINEKSAGLANVRRGVGLPFVY